MVAATNSKTTACHALAQTLQTGTAGFQGESRFRAIQETFSSAAATNSE